MNQESEKQVQTDADQILKFNFKNASNILSEISSLENLDREPIRRVKFCERYPSIISDNGGAEWGSIHPDDRYGSLSDNINILTQNYLIPMYPNRKSSFDRFTDNYGEYVVFEPIKNKPINSKRRSIIFNASKKRFSIANRISFKNKKSISIVQNEYGYDSGL